MAAIVAFPLISWLPMAANSDSRSSTRRQVGCHWQPKRPTDQTALPSECRLAANCAGRSSAIRQAGGRRRAAQ